MRKYLSFFTVIFILSSCSSTPVKKNVTKVDEASVKESSKKNLIFGIGYKMRLYNIDDIGKAYINNNLITETKYRGDSGWININKYLQEKKENKVKFVLENGNIGGWTYGFQIKNNDDVIFNEKCGEVGKKGCNNNESSKGVKFEKTISIKKDGSVFVKDNLMDNQEKYRKANSKKVASKKSKVIDLNEVREIYSGNTIFFNNGSRELTRSDGVSIYLSKTGFQKGKWFPKNGEICFKYDGDSKTHCQKVYKEGGKINHNGKNIVVKAGDPLDLSKKHVDFLRKNKASSSKISSRSNGWISVDEYCKSAGKRKGCFNDVTPKGVVGKWAGKALAVEKINGKLTGNIRVRVTWKSSLSSYKCGEVRTVNYVRDLKDFTHRSPAMSRCGGESQPYTGTDAVIDVLKYIYR